MTRESGQIKASAELAVSNISWPDTAEAHGVAMQVLSNNDVNAMDIAPMLVFPDIVGKDPERVDRDQLAAFLQSLERTPCADGTNSIRVAGLQGVTFGRNESIFSDVPEERDVLVRHMKGITHLAELVGAQTIVYGCLGTRLFSNDLSGDEIKSRATDFFTQLDPVARESNVVIGIEPVSAARAKEGTTAFGRSALEVVEFVRELRADYGVTHIKFLPDSFGMYDGSQDISDIARDVQRAFAHDVLAPHAQIAEPGMVAPTVESAISSTHHALDKALQSAFIPEAERRIASGAPSPALAIEMFHPRGISMSELVTLLDGAIAAARHHYGTTLGVKE